MYVSGCETAVHDFCIYSQTTTQNKWTAFLTEHQAQYYTICNTCTTHVPQNYKLLARINTPTDLVECQSRSLPCMAANPFDHFKIMAVNATADTIYPIHMENNTLRIKNNCAAIWVESKRTDIFFKLSLSSATSEQPIYTANRCLTHVLDHDTHLTIVTYKWDHSIENKYTTNICFSKEKNDIDEIFTFDAEWMEKIRPHDPETQTNKSALYSTPTPEDDDFIIVRTPPSPTI